MSIKNLTPDPDPKKDLVQKMLRPAPWPKPKEPSADAGTDNGATPTDSSQTPNEGDKPSEPA